jgi:hypothetical protein
MSPERAFELLAARRANPPEPGQTKKSPRTKTEPPKIEPPKTEHTKPKKKPARKRSKPKKAKKSFD